jgi:hypothetical protein
MHPNLISVSMFEPLNIISSPSIDVRVIPIGNEG